MRLVLVSLALAAGLGAEPLTLSSPSSMTVINLEVAGGRATYSVSFHGREVIRPSALGLVFEAAARLDSNFRLVRTDRGEVRRSWRPPYGERAEYPDRYNCLSLELREEVAPRRALIIEFRAYDEGAAFRYRLPEQTGPGQFVISDETTEFRLAKGAFGWETPYAQTAYRRLPVDQMAGPSERPFLLELPNGLWAAIAEAGVEDYSSMFLAPLRAERHSLAGKLTGSVHGRAPFVSPWRVVLAGEKPGELLEHNYLLQNLSPESRLKDTSWIRPGKVLREVTLSTRGGREAVDFAVRWGIQYIEYDSGWYGNDWAEETDATRVSVDSRRLRPEPEYQGLDLEEVIAYARSRDVGVILYIDRRALERQIDQLLPLYARWGVAGVKYGFVNVHRQAWTRWLYSAVEKAAAHKLVLNVHDEFRPTGMSRAYPHLLTQEGIMGNELFPDAAHSTILPFTRMLAGAADYTNCWLDPRQKNTWGHQMALPVILYSPQQFVYWYDRPVSFKEESAGMEWFRMLPTVWDDTRVIDGRPGEFAAIARRKGPAWYLGVITNNEPRELAMPLDMLDASESYTAEIFSDGDGPREVRKAQRTFRRGDILKLKLQARGGAAVCLRSKD